MWKVGTHPIGPEGIPNALHATSDNKQKLKAVVSVGELPYPDKGAYRGC